MFEIEFESGSVWFYVPCPFPYNVLLSYLNSTINSVILFPSITTFKLHYNTIHYRFIFCPDSAILYNLN